MDVKIHAKAGARRSKILNTEDGLKVYVKSPAEHGKANQEILEVLSEHFQHPKSLISIIRGQKSKNKLVRINTGDYQDEFKKNLSKKHCWRR